MNKINYQDKVDLSTNDIPNNQKITAKDMNTLKNVINNLQIYGVNQVVFFKTKGDALKELERFNNLTINVDYAFINNGEILGIGDNYNIVGDGIVRKHNIAKDWTDGHKHGYYCNTKKGWLASMTDSGTSSVWAYQTTESSSDTFGVDYPSQFKPQYREITAIIFYRKITINDLKE